MTKASEADATAGRWVERVLHFWFEELQPGAWFVKNASVDALVRERFLTLYECIAAMRPSEPADARECVAAVIVLDQFPRNMFRGSPRAYATDAQALAIAEHAIRAGLDVVSSAQQRMFLYMPFQHSEDVAIQARSVGLFEQLGLPEALDYARQHCDVIERFGRFPHRNAVLGRTTTAEEARFLATHPGF